MNQFQIGATGILNYNLSEEDGFLFAPGDKIKVLEYNPDFYAGWGDGGDALAEEGPVALVCVLVEVDGGIECWMNPDKITLDVDPPACPICGNAWGPCACEGDVDQAFRKLLGS